MPKFSLIIPVYNCANYINECINSIVNQDYTDYELVIIDDCSSDNSLEICKTFTNKYPQLKIFAQKSNKGVSAARNLGIENSTGKYITFIDADDFVSESYFQVVENLVQKGEYNLYAFGHYDYKICDTGACKREVSAMNYNADNSSPSAKDWEQFIVNSFFASPWNKIYLSDIIKKNNLRFDEECVCFEDYIFNINYCRFVKSFIGTDVPIYNYRFFESVNHISKRKWGKPFVISKKVARANDFFISTFKNESQICNIRRYAYTAYMNELQAIRIADIGNLNALLNVLIQDKQFRMSVKSVKHKGKYLWCLRLAFLFNLKHIAKKLIYGKIRSK